MNEISVGFIGINKTKKYRWEYHERKKGKPTREKRSRSEREKKNNNNIWKSPKKDYTYMWEEDRNDQ